ncbi:hypothetical protein QBC35DRAFT_456314 [Podospora australis]|uniref:Uncharacterized protein n=1 Tax=Podospora australis TaxID=1536484 RepID=A0AAN6WK63_9PEZI|nr:hypothetical protein QBC35DRAFT_456314 [Podospora australis]
MEDASNQPARRTKLRNEAEWRDARIARLERSNVVPRGTCDDFPQSDEGVQDLVSRVMEAIKDTNAVLDAPRKARVKKGNGVDGQPNNQFDTNSKVREVQTMSDEDIEDLAWEVVFRARDAQMDYVYISPLYKDYKYMTRFNKAVNNLKMSKACVIDLKTETGAKRNVMGPAREFKRKQSNLSTNESKQEYITAGTESVKWKRLMQEDKNSPGVLGDLDLPMAL